MHSSRLAGDRQTSGRARTGRLERCARRGNRPHPLSRRPRHPVRRAARPGPPPLAGGTSDRNERRAGARHGGAGEGARRRLAEENTEQCNDPGGTDPHPARGDRRCGGPRLAAVRPGPRERYLSGYIEGESLFLAAPVAGTVSPIRARGRPARRRRRAAVRDRSRDPLRPGRAGPAQVAEARTQIASAQANAQQAEAEATAAATDADKAQPRPQPPAVGPPRRCGRRRRQGHRRRPGRLARSQSARLRAARETASARRAQIAAARAQESQARGRRARSRRSASASCRRRAPSAGPGRGSLLPARRMGRRQPAGRQPAARRPHQGPLLRPREGGRPLPPRRRPCASPATAAPPASRRRSATSARAPNSPRRSSSAATAATGWCSWSRRCPQSPPT